MSIIFVDSRLSKEEENSLLSQNIKLIKCPKSPLLYDAVSGHPDMLIHIINNKKIIVHKDMDMSFIKALKNLNIEIIYSKNSLKNKYPYDIILNGLSINNLFVHYIKYTDSSILSNLSNKKILSVKQGYTKCSTAILNDQAVMTSDKSIALCLKKEHIDVLLLPPKDILLKGLNYGFIGGCCGMISKNVMAFYGNLNYYAYGDLVMNFLNKYKIKPLFLKKGKLIDRGSILSIF